MNILKTLGSVWIVRRFPKLALAGAAYTMFRRHYRISRKSQEPASSPRLPRRGDD